jgi:hypothetical protein
LAGLCAQQIVFSFCVTVRQEVQKLRSNCVAFFYLPLVVLSLPIFDLFFNWGYTRKTISSIKLETSFCSAKNLLNNLEHTSALKGFKLSAVRCIGSYSTLESSFPVLLIEALPEASFLKERSRLRGKLAPMRRARTYATVVFGSIGAYARVGAHAKVGAYGSFKELPSETEW